MEFFFYHRPIQLGRVVAAKITVALLVNLLLGTWWLTILYGKGFLAILPARFIKQVVSVPIDSVIFYVLAKTLERSKAISMIKKVKESLSAPLQKANAERLFLMMYQMPGDDHTGN